MQLPAGHKFLILPASFVLTNYCDDYISLRSSQPHCAGRKNTCRSTGHILFSAAIGPCLPFWAHSALRPPRQLSGTSGGIFMSNNSVYRTLSGVDNAAGSCNDSLQLLAPDPATLRSNFGNIRQGVYNFWDRKPRSHADFRQLCNFAAQ